MFDDLHKDSQVILCDMCLEDKKPARKTCMKCEISMCVQHLQAHLTTPVLLQTHPLTEPMASGEGGLAGTTKCPQHGKLLEYYCLDDLTCVCVSCAIEDQHSKHNMKTFSTAHKQLLEKVKAEQQALQKITDDETVSLEKWEESEREKLGYSSVRLIKAMTKLRDLALTSVQSSVSARMVSIRTSRSSLEAAEKETDTFRFLQMYSQVHQDLEKAKAADLRKGLVPDDDRDKLVQEIIPKSEKIVAQVDQFMGSLLTHVDQKVSVRNSETFFDLQTLGQAVTLSRDQRKVFLSGVLQKSSFIIQGTRSSTDPNIHSWVISLSSDCDWIVGLIDKNYAKMTTDGEVFGLCYSNNKLTSLITQYDTAANAGRETNPMDLFQMPDGKVRRVSRQVVSPSGEDEMKQMAQSQKIEVIWSYPDSLSFYDLTGQRQRKEIVVVPISSRNQRLTPFVCLELKGSLDRSLHSAAFIFAGPQKVQRQRKCSCGRLQPENNIRNWNGSFGVRTPQQICSCGRAVIDFPMTEELCELL